MTKYPVTRCANRGCPVLHHAPEGTYCRMCRSVEGLEDRRTYRPEDTA